MAAITEHNMAPLYTSVCKDLKWQVDGNLLAKMEENNMIAYNFFEKEMAMVNGNGSIIT